MNYILGNDRSQVRIECIEDYVGADSEVRIIDKIIDSLNIESLGFKIGNNFTTGRPMYDQKDMLKLFVYGYFNGIRSSRKLAKQAKINCEVIWLVNGVQPKYRAISDFRKDNIDALTKVFESFVKYCIALGLYWKEFIAVDDTKLEASASKRNHYSKNKIIKMKALVQSKINEYVHDLEINDLSEDKEEIELKKEEIQNVLEKLESKLKEYDELQKLLEENDVNEVNLTDPDARTVKFSAHQGTDVGYNIQAAVDSKNRLITTFGVINSSADQGQLYNMSTKAKSIFDVKAKYSQRQEIIEHVFGTLKRSMNFTHFLLRGFRKVTGEVSIAFFSYNLKRVINVLGVEKFLGYLSDDKIRNVAA